MRWKGTLPPLAVCLHYPLLHAQYGICDAAIISPGYISHKYTESNMNLTTKTETVYAVSSQQMWNVISIILQIIIWQLVQPLSTDLVRLFGLTQR